MVNYHSFLKRCLDIAFSVAAVLFLAPLMLVAAVAVRATSRGPIVFIQERMGMHFRPFRIYKFRSMVADAAQHRTNVTSARDLRITWVGRVLRKTKIDELPQLFNVLKGDMSVVGPRPEVAEFVDMYHADYERILSVRPGITSLASVEYRNEESILARSRDPLAEYVKTVLPAKIRLDLDYVENVSTWLDLKIIVMTLIRIFRS